MLDDRGVAHRLAADQMFLDDPLEDRRIALAIPGAFGIDDGNRPAFADAQAVGFGSENAALFGQPQFLEARLEKVPGDQATMQVAALRLGLVAAEKDVAARNRNTDALCLRPLRFIRHGKPPAPSPYTPYSSGFHSRPSSLGGAM